MIDVSFQVNGLDVQGVRWPRPTAALEREGRAARPVLLVHGLAGCTIEWEPIGAELADVLGVDVVAIDLPGFGRTRLPRGRSAIPLHVRTVRGVLEAIGPATLIGNSMGGVVGMAVAAQLPKHVDELVLVDPALITRDSGAGRSSPGRAVRYAVALTPVVGPAYIGARRRRSGAEGYVRERLTAIVADPTRVSLGVTERLVAQAEMRGAFAESARCYSSSARSIFTGSRGAWQSVPQVAARTLVVHGRHDALVPVAMIDRLRSSRPDWDYEIFDDAGHQPYMEVPEQFVATVSAWIRHQRAMP